MAAVREPHGRDPRSFHDSAKEAQVGIVWVIIIGLVGLFWLIPWMLVVKNDKPTVKSEAAAKRKPTVTVPLMNLVKSPVIWGTLIINFCYNYFVFYCMTWMPAYFVERRHLSLDSMGLYTMFSFGGMATVSFPAARPRRTDWWLKALV